MANTDADTQEIELVDAAGPTGSKLGKTLRILKWGFVALFFLLIFTVFKVPETRLKNLVHGYMSSELAAQGISLMAQETDLNIGLGVSYTLRKATLRFSGSSTPMEIDEVHLQPTLTSLFLGKLGGSARIRNGTGTLELEAAARPPEIDVEFEADRMNLADLALLENLAGIKGGVMLNGRGRLKGDMQAPATWDGEFDVTFKDLVVDRQTVQFFPVPRITVSGGKLSAEVSNGKARIRSLQLGKAGNAADDLTGTVTGTVDLGKQIESSKLNLKASFTVSDRIKREVPLIETFLNPGQKPDGSYSYLITGPMSFPQTTPAK